MWKSTVRISLTCFTIREDVNSGMIEGRLTVATCSWMVLRYVVVGVDTKYRNRVVVVAR